jgi:hypothetical protein
MVGLLAVGLLEIERHAVPGLEAKLAQLADEQLNRLRGAR